MTHHYMRHAITVLVILMLGFLVVNKAIQHAHASTAEGGKTCFQQASTTRSESLASGFSKAGAFAQAENVLARCLINR